MSKELEQKQKQIEEIAKDLAKHSFFYNGGCLMNYSHTAKLLYESGYRKQKEVAREIFEEIEKLTPKKFTEKSQDFEFGYALAIQQIKNKIAELKKKYVVETPIVRDLAEEAVNRDITNKQNEE